MKRVFSFFVLCGIFLAQEPIPVFDRIGVEQGLSQSTVSSIIQDQKGFLWIGTRNGLNRFDGRDFTIIKYHPTNKNSIAGNWVNALLEDKSGNIWVGTLNNGLTRINPATGEYFQISVEKSGLSNNRIRSIAEGKDGSVWIGTEQGLNKVVNGVVVPFELSEVFEGKQISAILQSEKFGFLVATDQILYEFSESEKRIREIRFPRSSVTNLLVSTITEAKQGELWIGTNRGFLRLKEKAQTRLESYPTQDLSIEQSQILSVVEDDKNNLWVGTKNGLFVYNQATKNVQTYRHIVNDDWSLSNNEVRSLHIDNTANLWVGTYGGGGLNKLNLKARFFNEFHHIEGDERTINSNLVRSFFVDSKGQFWVGTNKGINLYNSAKNTFRVLHVENENAVETNDVRVIYEDSRGDMWIGTEGGLAKHLGRGKFKLFTAKENSRESLSNNFVFSILEDSKGRFWIGTNGGGVYLFNRDTEVFTSYRSSGIDGSISSDFISFMVEDAEKTIWIGTFGNGVNEVIDSGDQITFKNYSHVGSDEHSISSNNALSFHQSSNGDLWFGTGGGLNKLNYAAGTFEYYTTADGLPDDHIYGIQSGEESELWVSTVRGISRFDTSTEVFRNYGRSDGLRNLEFKYNAYYKDARGNIYFGGTNGFIKIAPSERSESVGTTRLQFTDFLVYDAENIAGQLVDDIRNVSSVLTTLNMPKTIEIPYSQNEFTVQFASLEYTHPNNIEYAYKLLGHDSEWHSVGKNRSATFTNIPSGYYSLFIKSTDYNKIWSQDYAKLELRIRSPFWFELWFQVLIALFLLLIGGFYYRKRIRNIVRQNKELEEKVYERTKDLEDTQNQLVQVEKLSSLGQMVAGITHEVNTPLAYIASNVEVLEEILEDRKEEVEKSFPPEVRSAIAQIMSSTTTGVKKLTELVRELKDFTRIGSTKFEVKPLRELLDSALQIAKHRTKFIELTIEEIDVLEIECLPNQLNQVFLNMIVNSCDAMTAYREESQDQAQSALNIELFKKGEKAFVIFSDNGGGIDQNIMHKIFDPFFTSKPTGQGVGLGLSICYNIIKSHNGDIDVKSEEGSGTSFIITLPIRQKNPVAPAESPYVKQ